MRKRWGTVGALVSLLGADDPHGAVEALTKLLAERFPALSNASIANRYDFPHASRRITKLVAVGTPTRRPRAYTA